MKRVTALFLATVFIYNIVGYYAIYVTLVQHADAQAEQSIDDNSYDKACTITFKFPLTMPYPIQNGVERVTGEFEMSGEFFKLVEQRYENDTLYIVCLKSIDRKKAADLLSQAVNYSTDSRTSSGPNIKLNSVILKDFNSSFFTDIPLLHWVAVSNGIIEPTLLYTSLAQSVPTPPPNC
ncbi:MAG: hypothetical protein OJF59_000109 [Cytophagales bacterium]|jgi:hypothetical protein|nr:hypothetical protein [Bacteroidota bacterium]MBS1982494.1 hypothetical protein [Bacteroidota bacterium]WHZ06356.1 MAG: hypothetical protein OJF59_000109 [Cytophagales bacterium]